MLVVGICIGLNEFKTALDQAHAAIGSLDLVSKNQKKAVGQFFFLRWLRHMPFLGFLRVFC